MKLNEELLTPEFIERLKKQDSRFIDLDARLQVEKELRDSICLKILLETIAEDAAIALNSLATVDPTNIKEITNLQARVQRTRFIANTLNGVIRKGEMAEHSLNDERALQLKEE